MGQAAEALAPSALESIRSRFAAALARVLDDAPVSDQLGAAMRYAIFPEGKCIRPLFALSFARDLGADESNLLDSVAALELLHAASLVHDDLPALDNDDMRRGRLSCHRAHGEAAAILTGDALIGWSLARVAADQSLNLAQRSEIVARLGRAFTELCDGQSLDLIRGSTRPPLAIIAARKTGALFGASFAIGAIGAMEAIGESIDRELVNRAEALGRDVGICFQIADDLLDAGELAAQKGRAISSDQKNGKDTYLSTHGKEGAERELRARRSGIAGHFAALSAHVPGHAGDFPLCEQLLQSLFPGPV